MSFVSLWGNRCSCVEQLGPGPAKVNSVERHNCLFNTVSVALVVETASLESCGSDESKLRHPACMARAQGKRTVKTNHFCLKVKVTVGPEVKMKEQCP